MMKKWLVVFVCTVTLLLSFCIAGCAKVPTYDTYENEDGIESIDIEGMQYVYELGDWGLDDEQLGQKIGVLEDGSPIYEIDGDINRDYLYVIRLGKYYQAFIKDDFVFPDISADSVNRITWYGDEKTIIIEEKDIITLLINELRSNEKVNPENYTMVYSQIYCNFEGFPGLHYIIWVLQGDNIIMGSNWDNHFVKMSDSLLSNFEADE